MQGENLRVQGLDCGHTDLSSKRDLLFNCDSRLNDSL